MSTLRVNSGTIIASPTWEPTGLLQDQVLTQLASAPMRIFARGVKLANAAAVQRPHDADTRKHRRAARRRYKDQGLHCGLPLRGPGVQPSEVS